MRIFVLGVLAVSAAFAQTPGEPPALIRLIRGQTAPAEAIRPYADGRAALNVMGLAAVSGLPENWLIELHDTFASIEAVDRALSAVARPSRSDANANELSATARTLIATYRPQWSYRPQEAIQLFPKARYVLMSVYRTQPGTEVDFSELAKERQAEFDSINLDRPDMTYQVISGVSDGMYLIITPLQSLRAFDTARPRTPVYAEHGRGKGSQGTPGVSREHLLFRVEPSMSWVSDEFASADQEFWSGKTKQP